jgi:imidazole glycerol phosphate synthase subunit HisF
MGKGLNIDILKIETNHPKIAMGGVGKYEDIVEGLRCSDGVAVGNLFSFKEISARQARTEARRRGLLVR